MNLWICSLERLHSCELFSAFWFLGAVLFGPLTRKPRISYFSWLYQGPIVAGQRQKNKGSPHPLGIAILPNWQKHSSPSELWLAWVPAPSHFYHIYRIDWRSENTEERKRRQNGKCPYSLLEWEVPFSQCQVKMKWLLEKLPVFYPGVHCQV